MADQTEAEVSLQQLEVDGDAKIAGKKGSGGRAVVLDKTKLIILAVVILILLIIIIVLAAVLGHERASKKTAEVAHPGEKEQDTNPTTAGPTTPGPEPWWQIRLPDDVTPYHYDLTLHIDLKEPHFKGTVKIWVDVSSSTPYILLHAVNMNFTVVEVQKELGGIMPIKRHFGFEKNQFHVIELESPLEDGRYVVTVDFSGQFADNMRGLYKASFKYKNGTETYFAATQFEPLRARKAFPCFDEPAMKATFNVTLVHDPRLISLSNMPVYHSETKDGWKYDSFKKTVIMSTYLAAFFVGDFKYKEVVTKNKVQIRIYAREAVLDQVDYALRVSNLTMTYFEEFFDLPYPLPKSDAVALPAFGPGGMENWGLIKYKESVLLLKEGQTPSSTRETIVKIISHEIAHQWFGNIVTMKWWTDLWLNEGFATYVSSIGINHVHPEWNIIDQFIVRAVQDSLELDGLTSSHPVIVPVNDPKRIGEIFDAISYKKGASILLMLHYFLGTTTFRKGLTKYLTTHAYGNAESVDLWNAMTAVSREANKDINVRQMMNTWSLQMGYPVVSVKAASSPNMYSANQERFLYYKNPNATETNPSPYGYKWVIPFSYYIGARKTSAPPSRTFHKIMNKTSVQIPWDGNGWIKGNIGQTGFYRVNYDEKNWDALAEQLRHDHTCIWMIPSGPLRTETSGKLNQEQHKYDLKSTPNGKERQLSKIHDTRHTGFLWTLKMVIHICHTCKVLNATDRAGLIDDSFNLARANLLNYTKALDITTYLTKEVDYVPWLSAIRKFNWIMKVLPPSRPASKYLKKYVEHITRPLYNKLGMKDEGTLLEKFTRTILIDANCAAGVTSCLKNMTQIYHDWMHDPVQNAVPADLKALVYHFGIVTGGVEQWDFAYSQFQRTNVVSDKSVLLHAMAGAQESWLIERYLDYTLDPSKIGPRNARSVAYYIFDSNPLGADVLWNYFQVKWDEISKMFGGAYRALSYFIPQGTKRFSTDYQLQQIQDLLKNKLEGEALPWSINQAIEKVKANIQWRKTHEQDIESWLKEFFSKIPGSLKNEDFGFSDPAK